MAPSAGGARGAAGTPGASTISGAGEAHRGATVSDPGKARRRTRASFFADPEALKARVRETKTHDPYDVRDLYKKAGFCQMVARAPLFEHCTLAVVALNAVWLAVDVDLNAAEAVLLAHPVFQVAEHLFCLYFSAEWAIRLGAFERARSALRDRWFVFDSTLVALMVAETWVMSIWMLATDAMDGNAFGGPSVLRLLRLLRLSRMLRMAKLLRLMPELLILLRGICTAMKSVVYTLLLLFSITYVFAVAFKQITDGSNVGRRYFRSVPITMHRLLLDGALLDSPGIIIDALEAESPALVCIFYVFVLLAALTLINMLIGVLCEVVCTVADLEKEGVTLCSLVDGFQGIFQFDGLRPEEQVITKADFHTIMSSDKTIRLLESVQVDAVTFLGLADFIFADDHDRELEKELSFQEFVEVVLSLRGSNTGTVKDVVDLRKFICGSLHALEARFDASGAKTSKQLPSRGRQARSLVPDERHRGVRGHHGSQSAVAAVARFQAAVDTALHELDAFTALAVGPGGATTRVGDKKAASDSTKCGDSGTRTAARSPVHVVRLERSLRTAIEELQVMQEAAHGELPPGQVPMGQCSQAVKRHRSW